MRFVEIDLKQTLNVSTMIKKQKQKHFFEITSSLARAESSRERARIPPAAQTPAT